MDRTADRVATTMFRTCYGLTWSELRITVISLHILQQQQQMTRQVRVNQGVNRKPPPRTYHEKGTNKTKCQQFRSPQVHGRATYYDCVSRETRAAPTSENLQAQRQCLDVENLAYVLLSTGFLLRVVNDLVLSCSISSTRWAS